MGDLIIGNQLYEYIEFSDLYGLPNMLIQIEDFEGSKSGYLINREQAIQIIQHLQDQFQIKK